MVRTTLTGFDLLNDPRLNKGTAFTEREREVFALHGLLPPHIGTLDDQIERRRGGLAAIPSAFGRYRFLRDLQDANETLFYALLERHIEELLPIVYTPTVGEACERFSEIWHKARGLFLGYPDRGRIARILAHPRYDPVRCIVVSDGERILGLGDQGAGGMGIPIGKLALYTALGGIPPEACLPVLLDAGTDNAARLRDPLYIGWSHARLRGPAYDELIEAFVSAVERRWPHVLLQWEDFAGANAARLLARYRDRLCTFNDDIQGTAAVAAAALLSAIRQSGVPLAAQRIVLFGFGAAGQGIAELLASLLQDEGLTERDALDRFYPVDREGLLAAGRFGRREPRLAGLDLGRVVEKVEPTVLIGASGQPGAFTETIVRRMARGAARPVIFPLSNPSSRSEAEPARLHEWTGGRGLIGSGSPFPGGFDQVNNAYVFPGLALGIVAASARRVSDGMIKAAAKALAGLGGSDGRLLPGVAELRGVSRTIAVAVAAQAIREGLSALDPSAAEDTVAANVWEPRYEDYEYGGIGG